MAHLAHKLWMIRTSFFFFFFFFFFYEILPIAEENNYAGTFSYLIMKLYVVCTH